MFNMDIDSSSKQHEDAKEGDASHTKLEDMITELSNTLLSVKHEQEYMQVILILLFI